MLSDFVGLLARLPDIPYRSPFSFRCNTTVGIGGEAPLALFPRGEKELVSALREVQRAGFPHVMLGRGSNVLVSDGGFDGVVIATALARAIRAENRLIVAECGELITRVLFNKTTATGRKLVIVDASMTELIRPALYGSYHNIENITSEEEAFDKYTVVGTACESTDVFDENVGLRKTRRGDLLSIKSAGAYGMSMASRYNLHDLPGAVYSDEL